MEQKWIYNERFAPGVDHNDLEVAEEYDRRHGSMYDPVDAARKALDKIGLLSTESIIDMGAGTGTLAIEAARRCKTVYAMDISKAMLGQAAKKAEKAGVKNIHFINSSFLSYEHDKNSVDAIVSRGALHHLPDFWKGIAFQRFFDFLRPGGRLLLNDAIYSFDIREYQEAYNVPATIPTIRLFHNRHVIKANVIEVATCQIRSSTLIEIILWPKEINAI